MKAYETFPRSKYVNNNVLEGVCMVHKLLEGYCCVFLYISLIGFTLFLLHLIIELDWIKNIRYFS